jgi:23S rRNA-/tRNA-specific pseudouridylate synthase
MMGNGTAAIITTIRIKTGRKHQVCMHLKHAGMFIGQDKWYGGILQPSTSLLAFESPHLCKELLGVFVTNTDWKDANTAF